MDFNKICRICLKNEKEIVYYDIYTSYYVKRRTLYSDMLSNCTKLKPWEGDGLPRLMCKDCSRQLKRTFAFNLQCEESEKTLKCYLKNLQEKPTDVNCGMKNEDSYKDLIKDEDVEIKNENDIYDKSVCNDELKSEINDEVDIKCNNEVDDCWDAEDDNMLLEEIKLHKKPDNNFVTEFTNGTPIEKKKRGRKNKVFLNGEVHKPESKKPHQCDVCGKVLSTKSNLNAHKLCHTDLRPYKCTECPATFRGHSALFQHKKIHTGETPYHCEYCPKRFSRRTGLVNHIRMHIGEKLFSCDICFKSFIQSAQLSTHMKRHKGDKTYLCQDCGKGFPIKADLRVHQRIHNGEKPYSCHLCEKTFATSGNLSIHVRIHNKEVRYKCKFCQRGFVTCSAYNVHLKRHKGQRDYHCECGKTFYTSSALKQHKVVHTGEKNYQCKICDRKFSQTSHLSRHFRRDHAKPNVPVPSSDHYKLVLPSGHRVSTLFNNKIPEHNGEHVKCEEP